MTELCKRCGRPLTSPQSIARGYGTTCYRITELQKEHTTHDDDYNDLKNKWNTLSLKHSVLERKVQKIIDGGYRLVDTNDEAQWRNARAKHQDTHRPERDANTAQFTVVIKELNIIFNNQEAFDYHSILSPVTPRETIDKPPIVIEKFNLVK